MTRSGHRADRSGWHWASQEAWCPARQHFRAARRDRARTKLVREALVLCYGLGMAATLTLAGLLLVTLQERMTRRTVSQRWRDHSARINATLPTMTAVLVLVVGLGLALRSLLGPG